MTKKTVFNGLTGETTRVDLTAEEQTAYDNAVADFNSKSAERKLEQIKEIRLQKLIESDYLALSDVVLSDAWKTKRQAWRDIPQNNNTETEYDALLIRDADGNLTNTIWSDA
tara:strand:+ start:560 stop:895 length:336 start_codon:yes stop_codon:yes gene_type:complete